MGPRSGLAALALLAAALPARGAEPLHGRYAAPAAVAQLPAAAPSPPDPADPARDEAFLALFTRVCIDKRDAPDAFAPVEWSRFPGELNFMNTYDHAGTFLRGEMPAGTIYIARTRGEGHLMPGIETRCGVAIEGADYDRLVAALAAQLGVSPAQPLEADGMANAMLITGSGFVTVTRARGGWIILRQTEILIRMPRR